MPRFARRDHRAVQIVGVVVMVVINRQALCVFSEKLDKCRIAADLLGVAGAADMAIQANDLVGGAHHQVQIVGNHQHTAAVTVSQAGDQAIEFSLAGHVHALYRFVEHQQPRPTQPGPGQQDTLHFTAGNTLHGAVDHLLGADFLERGQRHRAVHTRHQAQEAQHRERQGRVDMQLLRHVADPQFRLAPDAAAVGLQQTEHGAHQCGLAGAIGAD